MSFTPFSPSAIQLCISFDEDAIEQALMSLQAHVHVITPSMVVTVILMVIIMLMILGR